MRWNILRTMVVAVAVVLAFTFYARSAVASGGVPTVAIVPSPDVTVGTPAAPTGNQLNAVAAASSSAVWAVGSYNSGTAAAPLDQTLIEYFDGTSWSVVPSPNQLNVKGVATENELLAVSADSATDVWAVGYYVDLNGGGYPVDQLLVEHYDGTSWALLPAAEQPVDVLGPRASLNQFLGVSAVSPTDVWAVGEYHNGSEPLTLIEHFNGTAWSQATGVNPSTTANVLQGVTATSATDVTAVGYSTSSGSPNQTLIEHYDGTSWTQSTSANTSATVANQLTGVSADSATDVWAVGSYAGGTTTAPVNQTLIEHYDGTSWTQSTSANTSATVANQLNSVSADSATDVWAVGTYAGGTTTAPVNQTLIEHYDGTSWTQVASPDAGSAVANQLNGVVAVSTTDVWSAGTYAGGTTAAPVNQTLIEGTPPASTTALASSVASPVVGQLVTYTATVTGSTSPAPTGTVTFADDGVAIAGCDAVPLSSSVATCSTTAGGAGSHTITAVYSGDTVNLTSTGTLTSTVGQASTTTTLSSPFASLLVNQPITFTATVTTTSPGSGVPAGTVNFTVGGTSLTGCSAAPLVAGAATCTYTPTATGSLALEAAYSGSTDDLGSTATVLTLPVITVPTTTTVASSLNPSPAGQSIVYTATVAPVAPATGTPQGTVTFEDNGTPVEGCSALSTLTGVALCLTDMPLAGTFSITATYVGSSSFAGSVSAPLSQAVQSGTLTIQNVLVGGNPSPGGVTLSPVTLGSAVANPQSTGVTFSNNQFAQATGTLNMVSISDGRGNEPGWSITAELESDFSNSIPNGPTAANVIPADFLTWTPTTVFAAAGDSLSGVASGPAATLSTSVPATLCSAAPGAGGGQYSCDALMSLAVPPYIAAGSYSATMVILTS